MGAGKAIEPKTVIPAAEAARQKARLAECETRIETGLRSFADVGQALAEIRDSRLYMLSHTTFEGYCEERWELRGKRPYEISAAAAVVWEISHKNMPPPAIESHAAALVKIPEDRRAEVWAVVIEATGGKPTAKAVAETWEALKPPADPHADLRRDHVPNGTKPEAEPQVSTANQEKPVPAGTKPLSTAEQETAAGETVAVTEDKPHVCRVFVCQGCGKPDTAFSEQAGKLVDEIEEARAENASLRERLSAALDNLGLADPGIAPAPVPRAADSAYAPVRDASGDLVPDYEDFGDPVSDDEDPWPGFSDELPARGRRGRP